MNKTQLDKEIESFSQQLQDRLNNKGDEIQRALIDVEKRCFVTTENDCEKFVNCMYAATKNLKREERNLELRTAFFQGKAGECFMNSGGNEDKIRRCKENAKTHIEHSFDSFIYNAKYWK